MVVRRTEYPAFCETGEINDERRVGDMQLVLEHLDGIPLVGKPVYYPEFQGLQTVLTQKLRNPILDDDFRKTIKQASNAESDKLLESRYLDVRLKSFITTLY